MNADTAMAIFKLAPHDPTWFRDRAAVIRALDTVLDTPLGPLVKYAGILREAKKAPDRAAIYGLVATGEDDVFALQEAKRPKRMTIALTIVHGAVAVDARCYGAEMAQRRSVIDDLAAIGIALRDCGVFAGMRVGFVRPHIQSYGGYDFDRTQPRARDRDWGTRADAIVELVDTRFQASKAEDANPAEARLGTSEIPAWATRTERNGLVIIKWAHSLTDKQSLDRGCEAHEDWLDRNLSRALAK